MKRRALQRLRDDAVIRLIRKCLDQGKTIEIEKYGRFEATAEGLFRFLPAETPRVFIAYAIEDAETADYVYDQLEAIGFRPWMDRRDLEPGQNWPLLIESAIEASDFFLALLSRQSVFKRGGFQSELRYALDIARRLPLDDAFLVPVRLDACHVPAQITREWQYMDLFPDREHGIGRIVHSLHHHWKERRPRVPKQPAA